ncbi:ribonuclease R [Mycoplasma corogypsi]|uniref:ribonuclease R n=1 Tax=Mycoplasma corogypsi TaxID=2106 RepID=UPI00387352AE
MRNNKINTEDIYTYIQKGNPKSFINIAKHFDISIQNNKELTNVLSNLQKEYKIFKNNNDEYYAPILEQTRVGVLSVSNRLTFGFVDFDLEINEERSKDRDPNECVFVKNFNFNGAMHGDKVEVNVYTDKKEDGTELKNGVITKVLERGNNQIIGFIKQKNTSTYFVPTDARYKAMQYRIVSQKALPKLNDLVLCNIVKIEDRVVLIEVEKIITNEADPMVFVKCYLEEIKAPSNFPSSLDEEVKNIPLTIENEDWTGRRDLRNEMIVTIDGDDTKDFDDAITVKKLPNGNYFLGVYIADVSYYVRENTEINKEALKRGTSIYLVDRVIPMLPVELSNGICSLNPNEDRFVMACEMEIDPNGNTVNVDVFQAIIESKYRLTYREVDLFYKTGLIKEDSEPNQLEKMKHMLQEAKELSLILHDLKIKQGYIDFDINEPKIKLDEFGSVKEIIIKQRGFSEVLIEDFMVRANETVAKFLYDNKLPVLYRVHELPDEDKLESLKNALSVVGISMGSLTANNISPKNFAELVERAKAERDDDYVKLMFLRTMQKAIYSPDNIKHFGLASDYYCHFTSPIRRYPDLVIHRTIRNFIINKDLDKLADFTAELSVFGDLNTKSEQKAVQIERNVNDLKFAEYLKNQIGQTFRAQILSIMGFGFFVEFDFKASGLVRKATLIDGEYEANDNLTKLVSNHRTFTLGDFVDVVVVDVDLVQGKVDCVLKDLYGEYQAQLEKAKNQSFRTNKKPFNRK